MFGILLLTCIINWTSLQGVFFEVIHELLLLRIHSVIYHKPGLSQCLHNLKNVKLLSQFASGILLSFILSCNHRAMLLRLTAPAEIKEGHLAVIVYKASVSERKNGFRFHDVSQELYLVLFLNLLPSLFFCSHMLFLVEQAICSCSIAVRKRIIDIVFVVFKKVWLLCDAEGFVWEVEGFSNLFFLMDTFTCLYFVEGHVVILRFIWVLEIFLFGSTVIIQLFDSWLSESKTLIRS